MKAGIITHYNVHNHGAVLQLMALSNILKSFGYGDCKALQFSKSFDFLESGVEKKYNIGIKSIPTYIRYTLKNGLGKTLFNIKKRNILNAFKKQNNLIGEYYSRCTDLDLVVIGADEIFSLEPGLNPCFYGMGIQCDKIISYGASFGPTTIDFIKKHNAVEFVRGGFETINHILVRDINSYEIAKSLTKKDVGIVCDPVLLYDFFNNYSQLISQLKNKATKYCVIYSYDNNMNDKETVRSIKEYARRHGLKIFSIGFYHKWADKNINATPLDLLKWFGGAEVVFTDTFHGTVISLSVHAQFYTRITTNINKLGFLLKQYQVEERLVTSFEEILKDHSSLDYEKVGKTIDDIRVKSLKLLKSAIEDNQNGKR